MSLSLDEVVALCQHHAQEVSRLAEQIMASKNLTNSRLREIVEMRQELDALERWTREQERHERSES